MERRVTDAGFGFEPCRLDPSLAGDLSTERYYAARGHTTPSASPLRSGRAGTEGTGPLQLLSAAVGGGDVEAPQPHPYSDASGTTYQYKQQPQQHRHHEHEHEHVLAERSALDAGADAARRERIVERAREVDAMGSDDDGDAGGGLGSGVYAKHEKSIGTRHNFSLDVMATNHPARITMQRSANVMLTNCSSESPQAFNALLETLRTLEPVSMGSRPTIHGAAVPLMRSPSSSAVNDRDRPRRAATNAIPRPPSSSSASINRCNSGGARVGSGRPRTAQASNTQSVVYFSDGSTPASRPLSARTGPAHHHSHFENGDGAGVVRPALSDPVARKMAASPDTSPAPNAYHVGQHYAIGAVPNRFFISSLPRETGGNIASLKHTVRPSDTMGSRGGSASARPRSAANNSSPRSSSFASSSGGGAGSAVRSASRPDPTNPNTPFSELYSAYWEPIAEGAPPLFDTPEQRMGMNYVFSDHQSTPFAMQLTRTQQQHAREEQMAQQLKAANIPHPPPPARRASGATAGSTATSGGGGGGGEDGTISADSAGGNTATASGGTARLVRDATGMRPQMGGSGSVVPIAAAPLGSDGRRMCYDPPKCGVSFTHERLLAERAQHGLRAGSKQACGQGPRSASWSMGSAPNGDRFATPVSGELKPFWVHKLEADARDLRRAKERAEKARERLIAEGEPIPFVPSSSSASTPRGGGGPSAFSGDTDTDRRHVVGSSTRNPHARAALMVRGTVDADPTRPNIPAAKFSTAPRNFSFHASKSDRNFAARMPGPGTYSTTSALFSSSRHHRVRTLSAASRAKLV